MFSLKLPSLHLYCSLPHMDSHILGKHSVILLTCRSSRMRMVGPFFFTDPNCTWGWLTSSEVETDGDVFGLVFVDEKERSQQDPFRIECHIDCLGVEVAGVKFWRPDEFRCHRRRRFGSVWPTSSSRRRGESDRAAYRSFSFKQLKQIWPYDMSCL